ncbi:hypothetical protein AMATHDRAFT_147404 [Amanita thiersii Skay4041]|uniref:J domain-containing protein n=1 Tax=Amanita thiersii Skay4041 TaxID=703135 RepID=A0A2A9NMT0_9AGAR|nr:hypothetical protein AMATHDRAFT_147404 [Amanita thiersii Skay4041]
MTSQDDESNPYQVLDIKVEATDQEIRTAYRQRSLKVHPDRNPNNPDAARKFHELTQAYELLLDPLRRLALDAKLRIKLARAERFKAYDSKRKNLVEELEERERAFKKARVDKQKEEVARWQETEKIKEEGRKLREQREQEMKARQVDIESASAAQATNDDNEPPALVRVKFTVKAHPELTTPSAIASLLSPFGPTDEDSIVLSLKPSKKGSAEDKKPKYGTALVPFKQIGNAFAAVCASARPERGLAGIEVTWVGGKEPRVIEWLKKMGKLGNESVPDGKSSSTPRNSRDTLPAKAGVPQEQSKKMGSGKASSFPSTFPDLSKASPLSSASSNPPGLDYESLTLMRLRQAERERLEREIRQKEEAEE